ncbi:hypothetical protein HanRHA438_Chr09g0410741 [Helianthus annuus]|uniref:Uncharacterized protein n=1 Tax=Helianthus annuus TaxID=4232 RepID=A0A251V3M9_HELAN|nr:hypothetical protein HanXRQr2_Chr09g0398991 [Helianthus annuus]KAJ0889240.1 hypothetical protein HanRHA438_Chr09g0410741 [Helianthus annuus]KAJ0894053.1 hypothetical protein HanPSC8_Chr09g0384761 [Helianthus annuus]
MHRATVQSESIGVSYNLKHSLIKHTYMISNNKPYSYTTPQITRNSSLPQTLAN